MTDFMNKRRFGFTLAEMMVVMLILTILLAMAAPLMTKKKNVDSSESPWHWASNNTDAFFGMRTTQTAMIGQDTKANDDGNPKLLIYTHGNTPAILFKNQLSGGALTKVAELIASGGDGGVYDDDYSLKIGGPYEATATGTPTTAFGVAALKKATGGYNTAFGFRALENNTSGSTNVAIGTYSLGLNTTGNNNVAVGEGGIGGMDNNTGTLGANTTGGNNIAVGTFALASNTTGSSNTAIGTSALQANTQGVRNIAIGSNALSSFTNVTYLVQNSPRNEGDNIAIGDSAMLNANNCASNVAIGSRTLKSCNGGQLNVAIGSHKEDNYEFTYAPPLWSLTSGWYNNAIGNHALYSTTTGSNNNAIGTNALAYNETGSYNTALGFNACQHVKGSNKTCIGTDSGPISSSDSTNIANNDKKVIWLGDSSTTVYIPGHLVVDKNTVLGYNKGSTPNGTTTWINMWDGGSGHALYAVGYGSHDMVFRSATITSDHIPMLSDKRLKNISGESKSGLEQVRALKVFDYTFKNDEKKTPHVGIIAQDLKKIFPNAVSTGFDGYYRIRQEDMFYAVVNAVKELDKFVQGILNEIKTICEKIVGIDNRVKVLEQENKQLKEQLNAINTRLEQLEKK